jgi:hypothetical protein
MHNSGIPIWFFIGVLLLIYGLLIFGYGVFEMATGCYPPLVQLTNLHTPIWWGAILTLVGAFYCIKFRPKRAAR